MALQPAHVSAFGRSFICGYERLRLYIYPDLGGKPTIGWGHLVLPTETFPNWITEADADALLDKDLEAPEQAIHDHCTVDLSEAKFDALVSFTFNCGVTGFTNSTLLRKLNAGDYHGAADEFLQWSHVVIGGQKEVSAGLLRRRRAERAMFISDDVTDPGPMRVA